jgi:hypothetical protein
MGWFIPWYLQRYYTIGWQISDPFRTLGLGISTGILLCIWDWVRIINNPSRTPLQKG